MNKRRLRYAPPRGPVAIAPKAWGQEYEIYLPPVGVNKTLYTEEGPYAVVSIEGPLSQRDTHFEDSYESIRARVASALESGQPAVCLRISSPGGDFVGCLELSRELRAMAEAAAKPLVAFADKEALSAAYAIATAAERIIATETASLGSIGVWAPRIDVTAQDTMMGVKVVIAASGIAKSDRNPHVALTDASFTRLQEQVDEQASLFFELVAEHRGMPVSKVKALDGADAFGQRALATGLADTLVNSWSAFLSHPEGQAMPAKGSQASKYDEALGAMRRAAEEDSEDGKKAKQALKAWEEHEKSEAEGEEEEEKEKSGDGDGDEDDKKEKAESKKGEAKSEGGEEEEKKEEEKKDEKAKKAKALAAGSNELTLAQEVQELKAQAARDKAERQAEKDLESRGKLYASRPDLSAAQKKAFDRLPLADAKAVLETLPRVLAGPHSSSNAMFPGAGGEGEPRRTYIPTLSQSEQSILAKLDAKPVGPAKAEVVGTMTQMPKNMTQAQAAAYAKELEKELEGLTVR